MNAKCIHFIELKLIFSANFISKNMNQSADPCDDFYKFACGNFIQKFERAGNHSVIDQLKVDLHMIIRGNVWYQTAYQ